MKHGPIALIDEHMPVLCLAPKDPWHEKMISQIQQAKARGGKVIAVATDGDELIESMADHVLWVPETPWMLSPVVTVLPLQLLAYHIAALRGRGATGLRRHGAVRAGRGMRRGLISYRAEGLPARRAMGR
jgi:glucosamine--fructose-6-phosphate aminotransferase (isomerizing)